MVSAGERPRAGAANTSEPIAMKLGDATAQPARNVVTRSRSSDDVQRSRITPGRNGTM